MICSRKAFVCMYSIRTRNKKFIEIGYLIDNYRKKTLFFIENVHCARIKKLFHLSEFHISWFSASSLCDPDLYRDIVGVISVSVELTTSA